MVFIFLSALRVLDLFFWIVSKTLLNSEFLQYSGIGLSYGNLFLLCDCFTFFDNPPVKFGVRRKGNVLFLNRGIDIHVVVIAIRPVDTYTLF